jgi:predicted RNase H-related nuclease YkuK (DUF458 family)
MLDVFRKLGDHSVVTDLGDYIREQIATHKDVKIYVGSDSHNTITETRLATVIVIHYGNNGAHVLYNKSAIPIIADRFTRLWLEVTSSVDAAKFLKEECNIKVNYVDLDLNDDPRYKSNSILRAALGYTESMGFKARWKPFSPFSVSIADSICR